MEKVKLTQEQADAIERFRDEGKSNRIILGINTSIYSGNCSDDGDVEIVSFMKFDDLARALYVGYEVDPEFKEGDWVSVSWNNGKVGVYKVTDVYTQGQVRIDNEKANKEPSMGLVKHATNEEIAKEKERRWWAKYGRKPWQLKRRDILGDSQSKKDGYYREVQLVNDSGLPMFKGNELFTSFDTVKTNYKIVCFAEDRKDV